MKHIEQMTSEQAIGEINRLALSDEMLTTALSEPYAQATGIEVQPSAPVTSDVEEMPSWMTYLLRKIFSTTATVFRGVSLLSEFRAVYGWLRDRLKGSADGTIPSIILDSSKPMSEHLRLLDNRKISNGSLDDPTSYDRLPDGVSLARLLCDNTTQLTEIIDDNVGWVMDKNLEKISVEKLRLNCIAAYNAYIVSLNNYNGGKITSVKTLELPELEEMLYLTTSSGNNYMGIIVGDVPIEHLYLPKLKRCAYHPDCRHQYDYVWVVGQSNYIKKIHAPELTNAISNNAANGAISGCSVLRSCIIPKYIGEFDRLFMGCPQLIHVEVCVEQNINLNKWIPTMALRTDTTAEDYVDLREDMSFANNLEQFLYNFQTYIANRAIDRTGTTSLTLTLSAEVYAALEAQEGQTILATLTNKNWTVASA